MVIGLSPESRARLLSSVPETDLTTWNDYTRCNTKDSLTRIDA